MSHAEDLAWRGDKGPVPREEAGAGLQVGHGARHLGCSPLHRDCSRSQEHEGGLCAALGQSGEEWEAGQWVSGGILTARLLSAPQQRAGQSLSRGKSSPGAGAGRGCRVSLAFPTWAMCCCSLQRAGEKGTWKPLVLERMRISLESSRIGLLAE